MNKNVNDQGQWLQVALLQELGPAEAPAELWDRLAGGPPVKAHVRTGRTAWALAAAVIALAVGLAVRAHAPVAVAAGEAAASLQFESGDPAAIRAWVNAHTGIDVALPGVLQPSVRLLGASVVAGLEPSAQVAYRVGDREASLLVVKAPHAKDSGTGGIRHADWRTEPSRGGQVSWVMNGQAYTLACSGPGAGQGLRAEDAQMGCLLCHA